MANVLSQDEVDSLLEGVTQGKVETGTEVPESDEGLKPYDFKKQDGPVHLRMPALGIINERFINFLRTSLASATRLGTEVTVSSLESVTFNEFCRAIPLPASLNIFKLEPLRGFAILVLEGPLVFSFVDVLFGGNGVSHVKLEGRSFTTIEMRIVEKMVKIILNDLQHAWSDIYSLKIIFTRSEMDPKFATIVTPNDMVIAIRFAIELENVTGVMTLCIPYSTIEPIRERLRYGFKGENLEVDRTWRTYIQRKIKEMAVTLSCTLGTAKLTGRQVLEMRVDDVIPLDQGVHEPIIVSVEGTPKFKGYPGSCSKNKAVRITERATRE
jgi:flagellar motor switch protein FliM